MTDEVDGVDVVQRKIARRRAQSLMTQVASSIDYRICGSMPRTEVVFVDTSRGIAEYVLRMKTGAEFKYSTSRRIRKPRSRSLNSKSRSVSGEQNLTGPLWTRASF